MALTAPSPGRDLSGLECFTREPPCREEPEQGHPGDGHHAELQGPDACLGVGGDDGLLLLRRNRCFGEDRLELSVRHELNAGFEFNADSFFHCIAHSG